MSVNGVISAFANDGAGGTRVRSPSSLPVLRLAALADLLTGSVLTSLDQRDLSDSSDDEPVQKRQVNTMPAEVGRFSLYSSFPCFIFLRQLMPPLRISVSRFFPTSGRHHVRQRRHLRVRQRWSRRNQGLSLRLISSRPAMRLYQTAR